MHHFIPLLQIVNETDDTVLSLQQAIRHLQKKKNLKPYKFMYRFDEVSSNCGKLLISINSAYLKGYILTFKF